MVGEHWVFPDAFVEFIILDSSSAKSFPFPFHSLTEASVSPASACLRSSRGACEPRAHHTDKMTFCNEIGDWMPWQGVFYQYYSEGLGVSIRLAVGTFLYRYRCFHGVLVVNSLRESQRLIRRDLVAVISSFIGNSLTAILTRYRLDNNKLSRYVTHLQSVESPASKDFKAI